MRYSLLIFALFALPLCSCKSEAELNATVSNPADAIKRARSEIDTFVQVLNSGNADDFSVKVPVEEDGQINHIWMTGIEFRDGKFFGTLVIEPGMSTKMKTGQAWNVGKNAITDWQYVRGTEIFGNYTLRAQLGTSMDGPMNFVIQQ